MLQTAAAALTAVLLVLHAAGQQTPNPQLLTGLPNCQVADAPAKGVLPPGKCLNGGWTAGDIAYAVLHVITWFPHVRSQAGAIVG